MDFRTRSDLEESGCSAGKFSSFSNLEPVVVSNTSCFSSSCWSILSLSCDRGYEADLSSESEESDLYAALELLPVQMPIGKSGLITGSSNIF